jgi:hypothetical protein
MESSVGSRFLLSAPLLSLPCPLTRWSTWLFSETGYSLGFAAFNTHMSPVGARLIGPGRYCHPRFPCQAMGQGFSLDEDNDNKEPGQL